MNATARFALESSNDFKIVKVNQENSTVPYGHRRRQKRAGRDIHIPRLKYLRYRAKGLNYRVKGLWRTITKGEYEATINGVKVRIYNVTHDVGGRRQWNIGVVDKNGRVDWVDSTKYNMLLSEQISN
jgi:hypothetical protein